MKVKQKILVVVFILTYIFSNTTAQNFQVAGTKILDPAGEEWVTNGTNVQGQNFCWPGNVVDWYDDIVNKWHFNTIRVMNRLNPRDCSAANSYYQQLADITEYIDYYTSRNIVVIVAFSDFQGGYYEGDEMDKLKNALSYVIDLYKDNPYVWLNPMTEPGGQETEYKWVTLFQELITFIRDEKQCNNILIIDGGHWGQDKGEWNTDNVKTSRSHILRWGEELLAFDNKTYDNIVFSIHPYDQWDKGTVQQAENMLNDYITRVHEKGFALEFGEYGTSESGNVYHPNAFQAVMNIAPVRNIGISHWAWWGGDDSELTTAGNGGGQNSVYNADNEPINLTWPGERVWKHSQWHWSKYGDGVPIPVENISVTPESIVLDVDKTATLSAEIHTIYATNKEVKWSIGDTGVASIDEDGVVLALKAGETFAYAESHDGSYKDSCKITVNEIISAVTPKGYEKYNIVYPNPSLNGEIFLTGQVKNIKDITIMNSAGNIVLEKQVVNQSSDNQIKTGKLNPGIYFIQVNTINKRYYDKLLVQ